MKLGMEMNMLCFEELDIVYSCIQLIKFICNENAISNTDLYSIAQCMYIYRKCTDHMGDHQQWWYM